MTFSNAVLLWKTNILLKIWNIMYIRTPANDARGFYIQLCDKNVARIFAWLHLLQQEFPNIVWISIFESCPTWSDQNTTRTRHARTWFAYWNDYVFKPLVHDTQTHTPIQKIVTYDFFLSRAQIPLLLLVSGNKSRINIIMQWQTCARSVRAAIHNSTLLNSKSQALIHPQP